MKAALLLATLSIPLSVRANARVDFLSRQLCRATDPRARAQAALLLGQTQEPLAVDPLCKALNDREDVVKAAAAKGLSQLEEPVALSCLQTVVSPAPEVALAIRDAISSLRGLAQKKPSFYVALDSPDNRANLDASLLSLLDERLRARLSLLGSVFAPPKESRTQASKVLSSRKLRGYLLSPAIHPQAGSGLKLTLLCFSYPERVLKGEISVKASGATFAELIRILAPRAIDDAASEFEWKD